MENGTMFPFQKDARKFANDAYTSLFLLSSAGTNPKVLKRKSQELYQRGKVSSIERLLFAIENNRSWNPKHVKNEVKQYVKNIKSTRNNNPFQDHKVVKHFIKVFLEGEIDGCYDYLTRLKESNATTREDTMAEAHFFILETHNAYVDYFKKGNKINVEFFTDRYLKSPEIFA